MRRSASDATPAAHGGARPDERLADALRSLADRLAATHEALGSLVSSVATESAPMTGGPDGVAPAAAVPAAPAAAAPHPAVDVPAGLAPHLRSVEALLSS